MTERVLVVGKPTASKPVVQVLGSVGYRVTRVARLAEAERVLDAGSISAIVVCVEDAEDAQENALIVDLLGRGTHAVVVVGDESTLRAAAATGAHEVVAQPLSGTGLTTAINHAIKIQNLVHSVAALEHADQDETLSEIVGHSPPIEDVKRAICQVSACDLEILVTGEPGVGKRLIAFHIHAASRAANGPRILVDLTTTAPEQQQALLFGDRDGKGALAEASGGTLILHEPSELRPAIQIALLRALSEQTLSVGKEKVALDLRLIVTTHRELSNLVALDEFDSDLYSRLATVTIPVAPLRERSWDILPLAGHFATAHAKDRGFAPPRLSADAARFLLAYEWPGNVRELRDVIEEACADQPAVLTRSELPRRIAQLELTPAIKPAVPRAMPTLLDVERRYIDEVLSAVDGNKSRASRVLGVDRRTLYRMLRRTGPKAEQKE